MSSEEMSIERFIDLPSMKPILEPTALGNSYSFLAEGTAAPNEILPLSPYPSPPKRAKYGNNVPDGPSSADQELSLFDKFFLRGGDDNHLHALNSTSGNALGLDKVTEPENIGLTTLEQLPPSYVQQLLKDLGCVSFKLTAQIAMPPPENKNIASDLLLNFQDYSLTTDSTTMTRVCGDAQNNEPTKDKQYQYLPQQQQQLQLRRKTPVESLEDDDSPSKLFHEKIDEDGDT